jgi:hypothetical protein
MGRLVSVLGLQSLPQIFMPPFVLPQKIVHAAYLKTGLVTMHEVEKVGSRYHQRVFLMRIEI